MIMHSIQEFVEDVRVDKIVIDPTLNGYRIEVKLSFPFGTSIPDTLVGLQEYTVSNMERFSGIHIEALDFTVGRIKKHDENK